MKSPTIHKLIIQQLATMPPLDNWPLRPAPFRYEDSQVINWIASNIVRDHSMAITIFTSNFCRRAIIFNPSTNLWTGRDYR